MTFWMLLSATSVGVILGFALFAIMNAGRCADEQAERDWNNEQGV